MNHQVETMQKSAGQGNHQQQWRQVAGLNFAVLDEKVSVFPCVPGKLVLLLALLGRRFDYFNARHSLGQNRVHFAKLVAQLVGDRLESARVMPQGENKDKRIEQWG